MQSLRNLIGATGILERLKSQLEQQRRLTETVKTLLPPPLDEQLRGAVVSGRTLTLLVHSPVWASRLRYMAPQLLRQLRQQGLPVEQLRPRVVPAQDTRRRPQGHSVPPLSPQSADALRQTADALEEGPLQEALRRLSRHQK